MLFCCFKALKAQDLCEPTTVVTDDHLEGEKDLFALTSIDDGYEHIFKILKDEETGVVRLQASIASGEMQNTPVWTAFITHILCSRTWKRKAGRKVYLADLQLMIFTASYSAAVDPANGLILHFLAVTDANHFWNTLENLKLEGEQRKQKLSEAHDHTNHNSSSD